MVRAPMLNIDMADPIKASKSALYLPIIAAGMCVSAMLPGLPYGYFMLLRWVVCVSLCYAAHALMKYKAEGLGWACVAVAVLFNPIFKVHLTRDVWWVVDGAGAAFLVFITCHLRAMGRE